MDVSDVLRDRMREPGGLQRMAMLSIVAHAVCVAVVLLAPGGWLRTRASEPPRVIMNISLGGVAGPANGGMTSIGGRPVQAVTPPAETRREAVRPPAAKVPEMTLPLPNARPAKAAAAVPKAPDDARGKTPTRGKEVSPGSAVAETGTRGQGFGLSTGGGAGSGSSLDVADFCCPDYLVLMIDRIRSNWVAKAEFVGETLIKFTIQRDGRILPNDVALAKSSGYTALDLTAQRAVYKTLQLPPLPSAFPNPTLTVNLNFIYQR